MEQSLALSKDLFMNSMEIYKILSLDTVRRKEEALDYVRKRYDYFQQIIEKSDIMPSEDILPPLEQLNEKYFIFNRDLNPPKEGLFDNIKDVVPKWFVPVGDEENEL
jgi:hypothetical protein